MNKEQTRVRLVEAAAQLFIRQGFAATGVAEILREADAGSGSLYYYFRGKEDLVPAVLEHYAGLMDRVIFVPVFARTADPIERVFGVLAFYRRYLAGNGCARGCPIGNLACELSDSHPELRERINEMFGRWRGKVLECLDAAAERLPEGTDREGLATFVLSVMEGAVMQARGGRDLKPFDQSIAHLRAYFDLLLRE